MKKLINKYTITGAFLVVAVTGGYFSQFFFGPDNPIEEAAEKIIEKNTGYEIDLTPNSIEYF